MYFHSSLGSHVKSTFLAASRAGYLQGCPGLTAEAINKFIMVEEATEMGQMTKAPAGVCSTTTKSKRGRTAKDTHLLERLEATAETQAMPQQEPENKKTNCVFMTTKVADGFIASDQTGAYPRTSHRGYEYLCIFYIYDANRLKAIPVKSRHSSELLRAYQEIYK